MSPVTSDYPWRGRIAMVRPVLSAIQPQCPHVSSGWCRRCDPRNPSQEATGADLTASQPLSDPRPSTDPCTRDRGPAVDAEPQPDVVVEP